MKSILKFNKILVISLFLLMACGGGGDDDSPVIEPGPLVLAELKLTTNSWSLSTVSRNGVDVESEFTNFTINFTPTGFTVTNGGTVWEASGNWIWADGSGTSIQLSNGVVVQIEFSNNDSQLTLTFTIDSDTYNIGRSQGLKGDYVFVLTS